MDPLTTAHRLTRRKLNPTTSYLPLTNPPGTTKRVLPIFFGHTATRAPRRARRVERASQQQAWRPPRTALLPFLPLFWLHPLHCFHPLTSLCRCMWPTNPTEQRGLHESEATRRRCNSTPAAEHTLARTPRSPVRFACLLALLGHGLTGCILSAQSSPSKPAHLHLLVTLVPGGRVR